ncbi:Transcription factor, SBP-box [Ostreococcus tauri]|uniref:Transcription factor, SBP-box n=1 Tax=Ostreococcus tauri TaxID=70448 RepID=A0A096P9A1_OSTTA|nr:Transcription factor, SBP-box [Ostreococcus tauri]CEG00813.1 Transcription factor, SBP-box [Ostreococcus tauri]|eukprot:XP_022840598.1 Transcription factor, SBP-box [Ostreococcus tauri]
MTARGDEPLLGLLRDAACVVETTERDAAARASTALARKRARAKSEREAREARAATDPSKPRACSTCKRTYDASAFDGPLKTCRSCARRKALYARKRRREIFIAKMELESAAERGRVEFPSTARATETAGTEEAEEGPANGVAVRLGDDDDAERALGLSFLAPRT